MAVFTFSFHVQEVGIEQISKLTFEKEYLISNLEKTKMHFEASEIFYLATCNRVEFSLSCEKDLSQEEIESLALDLWELTPRIFIGIELVARHLLRVALSRDSVILGENQILGQFKRAYHELLDQKMLKSELAPFIQKIISLAKQIRSNLPGQRFHTSAPAVAAKSVVNKFSDKEIPILVVGAGETQTIFAKYLNKRGYRNLFWTNRSNDRAKKNAEIFGGQSISWESFEKGDIPEVKVISFATGARRYLINREGLKVSKTKLVIDLSVPQNVCEKTVRELKIEYIGIRNINSFIEAEKSDLDSFIGHLDSEIDIACRDLINDIKLRRLSPYLTESKKEMENLVESLLNEGFSKELSEFSVKQKELLINWSQKFSKKLTFSHLQNLRNVLLKSQSELNNVDR